MRLRIKVTPVERELDGLKLDSFVAGSVRDVSPTVALWLIANGYADVEMRSTSELNAEAFSDRFAIVNDRRFGFVNDSSWSRTMSALERAAS